jgi:hypothetical protein
MAKGTKNPINGGRYSKLQKNTNLQSTQPTIDTSNKNNEPNYTDYQNTVVPGEKSWVENLLAHWESWGKVSAIAGGIGTIFVFIITMTLGYADFKNNISNATKDITKIDDALSKSATKIQNIEKNQIILMKDIEHVSSNVIDLKTNITGLEKDINKIEMNQIKHSH